MDDVIKPFERMGARAVVVDSASALRLNIVRDRRGQLFEIARSPGVDVRIVDASPRDRHLLLMGVEPGEGAGRAGVTVQKHKFLCGHDEREWFVAGVPNSRGVSNIATAMEALKPTLVRWEQERKGVRTKDRARRRTSAYVRQGEWFFVPMPGVEAPRGAIFRNEPLRRGNGKPHWAELLFRFGGETVYVSHRHVNGITEAERQVLFRRDAEARKLDWRTMRRNPQVYVKGRISHPDHATIHLSCWHLVQVNTEHQSAAMRHVAFLD